MLKANDSRFQNYIWIALKKYYNKQVDMYVTFQDNRSLGAKSVGALERIFY